MTNKFALRLASALVLAPLSIFCVYAAGYFFFGLVFLAFIACLHEWGRMCIKLPDRKWLTGLFGFVYFASCYAMFFFIRAQSDGIWLIFLLFVIVWGCDIGAYVFGKIIGGEKCVPLISPNKTWAGVWGGAFSAVVLSLIYVYFLLPERFSLSYLALMAVVIAFASMLGDLLISYVKRRADVKDTGHLIPGHGGVLDRIDSLILATVPMAYFVYWDVI